LSPVERYFLKGETRIVSAPAQKPRSLTMELLVLAMPIIGMMVTRLAMTTIDVVMCGQLGTEALAAISPASVFVFVVGCLGMGIAHGVQTFVSQVDGRGQPREAGGYVWQSFYIALLSVPVVLLAVRTAPQWFGWLAELGQHSPRMVALELSYIEIAMWTVPFSIACIGMNAFFSGIQRPGITLAAILLSLVVNVIGNWLLIFGATVIIPVLDVTVTFPRLELAGAAIATVLGWATRAVVLFAALMLPRFENTYRARSAWAPDWPKMAGLLRVGAPTSIQWFIDLGSWTVFLVLIMPPFGTEVIAATNAGLQLMHFSFMPALGVGIALSSQVGYAIGEGRPEMAVVRTRIALRVILAYMLSVGVLFLLIPGPLLALFNPTPEVLRLGAAVLAWAALFQFCDALCIAHMNALRGAGDTRWPAVVVFLCCWVIFVGGGYTVARVFPEFGLNGPWAMTATYICVLGGLLAWRWHAGKWRDIRLFDQPAAVETAPAPDDAPDTGAVAAPVLAHSDELRARTGPHAKH
jgi:MATE family multidrug resistance protein